jgi:hypothetical protein
MTWRYRIIRDQDGGHRIAEVYTDLPHVPGRTSWTADPIAPYGDSLAELQRSMNLMTRALHEPVLDETELKAKIEGKR